MTEDAVLFKTSSKKIIKITATQKDKLTPELTFDSDKINDVRIPYKADTNSTNI